MYYNQLNLYVDVLQWGIWGVSLLILLDSAAIYPHFQMAHDSQGPTPKNVTHCHLLAASKPKELPCFGVKICAALKVFTLGVPLPSDWTFFPHLLLVSMYCRATVSLSAPSL